jgi:hypothetical protein
MSAPSIKNHDRLAVSLPESGFINFLGVLAKWVAGSTNFANTAVTASGRTVLSAIKNNLQVELIPA